MTKSNKSATKSNKSATKSNKYATKSKQSATKSKKMVKTKSKKNKNMPKLKRMTKKRMKKIQTKNTNSINIDNTGTTEILYAEGNQSPKKTVFEWNGNYDGKNAKIHMDLDVNGKKTKTDLKLSNHDLMNILGSTNVIDRPIDQRLQSLDEDLSNMYPSKPVFIDTGDMPEEMPEEMPLEIPFEPKIIIISNSDPNSKRKRSIK